MIYFINENTDGMHIAWQNASLLPPFRRRYFHIHFRQLKLRYFYPNFAVPKSTVNNKPTSIQIIALRLTGDMPLSESKLTHFIDAYIGLYILRPKQNGQHFPGDIFKYIFLNESISILNTISLKSVPKDPIGNNTALVQIMALCRIGDKPLSEQLLVKPAHAYIYIYIYFI